MKHSPLFAPPPESSSTELIVAPKRRSRKLPLAHGLFARADPAPVLAPNLREKVETKQDRETIVVDMILPSL